MTHTPLTSSLPLSQSGADINAFNTMGWSPLHCAASAGNAEMVRLLLQVTTPTALTRTSAVHQPL